MRDMLRVSYTKLSSGECSSKTLDTKPEWTLLEHLVLSIFQHTIRKNIINLHIYNNMMYTSNYQWTTISTFTVIDNFQFISTYLILWILVKYIIPYQILNHSLFLQSASKQLLYINGLIACQLQLQPLVLSYDLYSSWAIQYSTVNKHDGKWKGNTQFWIMQK